MFHVKHFGTIEALRNVPSQGGAKSGAGIWGKRNSAIGLSFGPVIFWNCL
jgi:hypothetical protein